MGCSRQAYSRSNYNWSARACFIHLRQDRPIMVFGLKLGPKVCSIHGRRSNGHGIMYYTIRSRPKVQWAWDYTLYNGPFLGATISSQKLSYKKKKKKVSILQCIWNGESIGIWKSNFYFLFIFTLNWTCGAKLDNN